MKPPLFEVPRDGEFPLSCLTTKMAPKPCHTVSGLWLKRNPLQRYNKKRPTPPPTPPNVRPKIPKENHRSGGLNPPKRSTTKACTRFSRLTAPRLHGSVSGLGVRPRRSWRNCATSEGPADHGKPRRRSTSPPAGKGAEGGEGASLENIYIYIYIVLQCHIMYFTVVNYITLHYITSHCITLHYILYHTVL